jgi:PEGA domain
MTCSTISDRAALALILAAALSASPARAQPAAGDPVAAQALFKAAREMVDAGDWAGGCAKFEASLALQASASTMLNIAKCHEHDGKIASAWDAYNRALTLNTETRGDTRRKGLEGLARKGVEALAPRLPKLRVTVAGSPAGLRVLRDGKEIPAGALGDALPSDPGPHEIQVSAPGFRSETRAVTLEEGKTAIVSITLTPGEEKPAGGEKAGGGEKPPSRGVPVWAWITGAGGLVLSGVAVYFLVDDLAAVGRLQSSANCAPLAGGGYACNPHYDYQADDARKNRDLPLAIALGSAGVLALGAAVGGIVLGTSAKRETGLTVVPWAGAGSAGAVIGGVF